MQKIFRFSLLVKYFILSIVNLFRPREDLFDCVITFTSYNKRIGQSWLTILSILGQNRKLDVVMFIAGEDRKFLPLWLKTLPYVFRNFNIMFCQDIRSYKKVIPLLDLEYVNSELDKERLSAILTTKNHVITVDDDVFYSPYMVSRMVKNIKRGNEVVYNTGRYFNSSMNYSKWPVCTEDTDLAVLPVGAGGILYPLEILRACYVDNFLDLAPTSDDIWLFSILKDKVCYSYGNRKNFVPIARLVRQRENLYSENQYNGNDAAIKRIFK